jgi:chorismate mutase/prephenate dehydratase
MTDRQQQLQHIRAAMEDLDRTMVQALDARARLSREIHELHDGQTVDVGEGEWLAQLLQLSTGALPAASLRRILQQVRAEARALEQPVHVGHLGTELGFCHQAARSYFGAGSEFVGVDEVRGLFEAVKRGHASYVVFPFESSVGGLIQPNINALAETDLVIVAQRELATQYDLVSSGVAIGEVRTVYASAQALTACELILGRELTRATAVDVRSPAAAVKRTRTEPSSAAIVPASTAAESGLEIVRANVGDAGDVKMRFAVAGPRPASRTGNDTTCLLFSVNDEPGALYGVLRHFAEREVNLKRMQARPVAGEGFDYVFFVELDGHVTDRALVTAIEAVKRAARYFRILGSFPALG